METGFQQVPIKQLVPSQTNHREIHDPKSLEDLADSIRTVGILEPLLGRPVNGSIEIVAGNRRLAAAKKAGLEVVPVIVRPLTDVQALETQIVENLQRESIHPLDEAEGFRSLMEKAKWDVATIAEKIGKSTVYVYQRLQLAHLLAAGKKAFAEGIISAGHAILLSRLQPADQAEAFKECFERVYEGKGGKVVVSISELKNWIARHCCFHLDKSPWAKEDKDLLPEAGSCTSCTKRSGANPSLFADMKGSDICTDRSCFAKKMKAYLAKKETQFKEKGVEVQRIATDWLAPQELKHLKALGQSDYKRLLRKDKKCDHVAKGLVVSGDDRGQAYDICTDSKCQIHGSRHSSRYQEPPEAKARRKAQEKKDLLMTEVRKEAISRVLATKKPWTDDDLALVAGGVWNEIWDQNRKKVMARRDWKSDNIKKQLGEMKSADLWMFLFEVVLTCMSDQDNYQQRNLVETFDAACARYGVDLKKVTRDVVAAKVEQK